jgi:hypothetical protein
VCFDPADNRQANHHSLAAPEIERAVGHEAVRRDIGDVHVHVTQSPMFADDLVIDRVPRSAAEVGYCQLCAGGHAALPLGLLIKSANLHAIAEHSVNPAEICR